MRSSRSAWKPKEDRFVGMEPGGRKQTPSKNLYPQHWLLNLSCFYIIYDYISLYIYLTHTDLSIGSLEILQYPFELLLWRWCIDCILTCESVGKPGKLVQIPEGQVKSLCTAARAPKVLLSRAPCQTWIQWDLRSPGHNQFWNKTPTWCPLHF